MHRARIGLMGAVASAAMGMMALGASSAFTYSDEEKKRFRKNKPGQSRIGKSNRRWSRGRKGFSAVHPKHNPEPRSAYQCEVERLTNWQRTQWAQAKYPGLSSENTDKLKPFLKMERTASRR